MKATAIAPANIAFIKYWGKKDAVLRLPMSSSVSMNLSQATTTTTVEFSPEFSEDTIELLPPDIHDKISRPREFVAPAFSSQETKRVSDFLDHFRALVHSELKARVVTQNSFPKATGIASSASGFAALTAAAAAALNLQVSEKELTILARRGSGSACRSIPDGFVQWEAGESSETSYAHSLYPSPYWDLRDIVVMVEATEKSVPSSVGHQQVKTSPLFQKRLQEIPERMNAVLEGLQKKDLSILGPAIEAEAMSMHQVMQTQVPPLQYFTDETKQLMKAVVDWRSGGVPVYYTIDAGPNVHLICEGNNEQTVVAKVKELNNGWSLLVNKPAPGARIITTHLF